MKFVITGNPKNIGMREFKALLHATDCVLSSMNLYHEGASIAIKIKSLEEGTAGQCRRLKALVWIDEDLSFSSTAMAIIHELIHVYLNEANEFTVSTLTSRIKGDVIDLANLIVERSQRWAAYRAHLKISYHGDEGEYNSDQFHEDHARSAGVKYRKG